MAFVTVWILILCDIYILVSGISCRGAAGHVQYCRINASGSQHWCFTYRLPSFTTVPLCLQMSCQWISRMLSWKHQRSGESCMVGHFFQVVHTLKSIHFTHYNSPIAQMYNWVLNTVFPRVIFLVFMCFCNADFGITPCMIKCIAVVLHVWVGLWSNYIKPARPVCDYKLLRNMFPLFLGLETFSQLVYEDEYGAVSEHDRVFFFRVFIIWFNWADLNFIFRKT